jgi:hypothetical protein
MCGRFRIADRKIVSLCGEVRSYRAQRGHRARSAERAHSGKLYVTSNFSLLHVKFDLLHFDDKRCADD